MNAFDYLLWMWDWRLGYSLLREYSLKSLGGRFVMKFGSLGFGGMKMEMYFTFEMLAKPATASSAQPEPLPRPDSPILDLFAEEGILFPDFDHQNLVADDEFLKDLLSFVRPT